MVVSSDRENPPSQRVEQPLQVAFIFPRFTGPYGPERLLLRLARGLAERGHKVDIYTPRFSPDCAHLKHERVRIVELGAGEVSDSAKAAFLDLLAMPRVALRFRGRYDIVHAMNWQSALGGYLVTRFRRKGRPAGFVYGCNEPPRVVYDLRDEFLADRSWFGRTFARLVLKLVEVCDRFCTKRAGLIVTCGEWAAGEVRRLYGRDAEVIIPGVEVARFTGWTRSEARARLGLPEDAAVFLSVSKLHRRKQVDRAIEIYSRHAGERSRFIILGDGPDEQRLRDLAAGSGVGSIEFKGRVSDDEVALHYAAADYLIFVAKNEPYGMVPVEAAVSGCWVITDGGGGFAMRIPEFTVSPEQELPQSLPPASGRDWAELSWDRHVEAVEKIYRALCTARESSHAD